MPSIDPYLTTDSGANWAKRDTGLPDVNFYTQVIDPFNHPPNDIDNTTLYLGGVGYLGYSTNGGQSWTSLTSLIPDPPDTYSSATPPTAETVTYTYISTNSYTENELLIAVEWYDVDTWRSYTLKRSAALSWSWEDGLATVLTVPTNWWETVGSTETAGSLLTWPEDKIAQAVAVTDTGSALQANGNGFSSNPSVQHTDIQSLGFPDNQTSYPISFRVTFDYYKAAIGSVDDLRVVQGGTIRFRHDDFNGAQGVGTTQSYDITFGGNIATIDTLNPGNPARESLGLNFMLEKSGTRVSNFKWELLTAISGGGGQSRQLGQDIDRHGGTNLYKIEWDGSDIVLLKRLVSDMSIDTQTTLGSATLTEIDDRDYYARVFCPPSYFGNADTVYVFGLWNDGSDKHIVKSTDGGATLGANIGGSWSGSFVSAFFAIDANCLYATIYNVSTDAASFWRTQDGGTNWDKLTDLPGGFECVAMSLKDDGRLVMANRRASSVQMLILNSPLFSSYTDVTGTLPTTGLSSVVWA